MERNNGGDMAREIELARLAVQQSLNGKPAIIGESVPKAQLAVTLLSNGQVSCTWAGDEIVVRFLFSKGFSIYEASMAQALKEQL